MSNLSTTDDGRRRVRVHMPRRAWGPLYAVPALVVVLVFIAYPFGSIIYHSFTHWDGLSPARWIGLRNFARIRHDPLFWTALRNNFILAALVPIMIVVPLMLAFLIHDRIPGWRFFRSTFFLPAILSTVTVGIIATQVLMLDGPLNRGLAAIGLGGLIRNWLARPITSLPAILLTVFWASFGYETLIYLGAMSMIDPELAEAARLDGARRWRVLWSVYVPNLKSTMELVLVIQTITAFAWMFPYVWVMTGGGPGYETYVSELLIYNNAFSFQSLGYASALGVTVACLLAAFGYFEIRLLTGGSAKQRLA